MNANEAREILELLEPMPTLIRMEPLILLIDQRSAKFPTVHAPFLLPNASLFSCPPTTLYPSVVS